MHRMFKFKWIKDPVTGVESCSLTFAVLGFVLAGAKLLFSGIEFAPGVKMSDFTGIDFAAVTAAAAGLYGFKKNQERNRSKQDEAESE